MRLDFGPERKLPILCRISVRKIGFCMYGFARGCIICRLHLLYLSLRKGLLKKLPLVTIPILSHECEVIVVMVTGARGL